MTSSVGSSVDGAALTVDCAPQLPTPHTGRLSPGHRVATATDDGRVVALWRWYDAVVVGTDGDLVRLWEPAHGEVLDVPRLYTDHGLWETAMAPHVPGAR